MHVGQKIRALLPKLTQRKDDKRGERTARSQHPIATNLKRSPEQSCAGQASEQQRTKDSAPVKHVDAESKQLVAPRPPLSRHQQAYALAQAANQLFGRATASEYVNSPHWGGKMSEYDADLQPRVQLFEALTELQQGHCVSAVNLFNQILKHSPSDRSALIYRWIAGSRDVLNVAIETRIQAIDDIVNRLVVDKGDCFARLIHLAVADVYRKHETTSKEIDSVLADYPDSGLAWSMRAAHTFTGALFANQFDRLPEAAAASCKALRLDANNGLAFSTLWHATRGSGAEEYKGNLLPLRASFHEYSVPYECVDIRTKAINRHTLYKDDWLLQQQFTAESLSRVA